MTTKGAGQIAYEARFPHAGGRGEKPWNEQSRDVHELWDRVAEAVRLKVTEPVPGWRESNAEDPHGTRYACPQANIAGGHLTHDQVAFAVAMADRRDLGLEGVLNVAKDRIRWLARRLHTTEQQLSSAARDAEGMRKELGLRASRIAALEADRATPPFGLPPGSLQAYSNAYEEAYEPGRRHLNGYIAGLRAVLEHFVNPPDWLNNEIEEDATTEPYAVLATLYDGTKILAPHTLPDKFRPEEIQEAIRDLVARTRGPRSGDMTDVVDAMNEARAEVL